MKMTSKINILYLTFGIIFLHSNLISDTVDVNLSLVKNSTTSVIDKSPIHASTFIFGEKYCRLIPKTSASYTFTSSSQFDLYGKLYNASGTLLETSDDCNCGFNSKDFSLTYDLIEGENYYLGLMSLNEDAVPVVLSVTGGELQEFVWAGSGSDTWATTSAWNLQTLPQPWNRVIIDGKAEIDQDIAVRDLKLLPSSTLTMVNNKTIQCDLLILESDAYNTASFIGSQTNLQASVQQYLTTGRIWYMSIPVNKISSSVVRSETENRLWQYDEPMHSWDEILTNDADILAGEGIVISKNSDGVLSFSGQLNAGVQTIDHLSRTGTSDSKRGYHLIGNPYPSCVDWNQAVRTKVEPTIWYRARNANSGKNVFDTYNALSKVGTQNNGNGEVTGIIPPMQSVWILVSGDGDEGAVSFNDQMRSHASATNKLKSNDDKKCIRLTVENGKGSDESIIVINERAINGFDAYDSPKMFLNDSSVTELYTVADGEKLAINGLSSLANQEVRVGVKSTKSGSTVLDVTQIEGLEDADMEIEDIKTHEKYLLQSGLKLKFNCNAKDEQRFVVRLKNDEANKIESVKNNVSIVTEKNIIRFENIQTNVDVVICDLLGKTIFKESLVNDCEVKINKGIYFVSVTDKVGFVKSQKVVIP